MGGGLTSTLVFVTAADLEFDFDHVRLISEVVPQPGWLGLILFAGGLIMSCRR